MLPIEITGSVTPGLEGAPHSQMHDLRNAAPQAAAAVSGTAELPKEDIADEASGLGDPQ